MKKFNLKKLNLNKTKTLILIAIVTLLLFVSGITYAYFQTQGNNGANANVNVLSSSTDNLIFTVEKDIYINASVANFGEGMGDLSDDTNATATLIPNNYDNTASAMYNIYIIIESNNLEYTTPNNTPELLLNVTDPNGNKLENITGLVHYEQGFDITTRTGGFLIASDYVIEANNSAEVQNWNIEITLANLDSNQNANTGKNFSAKIYMTQEKMSSYNPVQITNIEATPTYNTIDTNLVLSNGSADVDKYYFGIKEASSEEEVNFIESETPNYEFSNLEDNTEYIIYSYVVDVNNVKSNVYETRVTTNEYTLATISEVTHSVTLDSITLTVNATSGDGTITKYMYSNNDGESWIESDSNTYTFTNLSDTAEYKIRVKVVDSNGVESTEYYEAIATETYILPVVANVEYTTTYNSITLTPSGTDGTNTIDHYEYSIDNGEYQTSNVFSNLTEQTEYTINVKAIDSDNRESNPYTIQVTTDTYEIPEITNVSTSSTEDSITINVSANNGDGTITKYLYSRDNGSNWYESISSSYTFDNLTSNTTFYIQVKVEDENGRESVVYNTTETTLYINPVVNSVTTSNITSSSITLTVNATAGSNPIQTYYYSSNNGSSYVSSTSNTYTFSGLSAGTTYNFRVYVRDSGNVNSNEGTTSATTYICDSGTTLASCITTQVYTGADGENDLYYHDETIKQNVCMYNNNFVFSGDGSVSTNNISCQNVYYDDSEDLYLDISAVNSVSWNGNSCVASDGMEIGFDLNGNYGVSQDECSGYSYFNALTPRVGSGIIQNVSIDAGDNSYRYSGANPNNYVCFGDDCTNEDNLYRIIGVFGSEVKLIKSTSYGSYVWDSERDNTWNATTKPDIYTTLNSTYLNSLENTWSSRISTHNYEVGGGQYEYLTYKIPTTAYDYEVGANQTGYMENMKIGLMYLSDYYYGASLTYWTYPGHSADESWDTYVEAADSNWMYSEYDEWTISRSSIWSTYTICLNSTGDIVGCWGGGALTVRPVFYLNSTVQYVSGTGTSNNPIRLSV